MIWGIARNIKVGKNVHIGVLSRVTNSKLGDNVTIGTLSEVTNSVLGDFTRIGRYNGISNAKIGKYTYTGKNTQILASIIGNYCSISWNVTIGADPHPLERFTTHPFTYSKEWGLQEELLKEYNESDISVEIGHDVWIGANAVILRGVKVSTGAVIGAGAVVTKDIPPYAIAVGVPAKIIRFRFDEDTRARLLKTRWWELEPKKAVEKILDEFGDVIIRNHRSAK